MAEVTACGLEVIGFEFPSRYDVNCGKAMNPSFLQLLGK